MCVSASHESLPFFRRWRWHFTGFTPCQDICTQSGFKATLSLSLLITPGRKRWKKLWSSFCAVLWSVELLRSCRLTHVGTICSSSKNAPIKAFFDHSLIYTHAWYACAFFTKSPSSRSERGLNLKNVKNATNLLMFGTYEATWVGTFRKSDTKITKRISKILLSR